MAGYTPAFSSIYDGSLCGKWPTAVLWASLLPLIDSRGELRMSFEAIAARTAWPMDLLRQGIADLMLPDPDSQSGAEEGRRLVLLDPTKSWGWRAVNHGLYREKARLMAKASREIESGANKDRMKDRRGPPGTAGSNEGPPLTPSPDSDSDSDSNKSKKPEARALPAVVVLHESLPSEEWAEWMTLRRKKRWPLDELTLRKQLQLLRDFDTETQRQIINASIRSTWQGLFAPKANGATKPKTRREAPTTEELEAREAAHAGK